MIGEEFEIGDTVSISSHKFSKKISLYQNDITNAFVINKKQDTPYTLVHYYLFYLGLNNKFSISRVTVRGSMAPFKSKKSVLIEKDYHCHKYSGKQI